ncbi:hypothetical protein DFS33DRAFT_1292345 [Desarmillaria ectypa]|nr:hypothetical protein DFS33DRAFT_1292345 [Desarmillaria ectypa]
MNPNSIPLSRDTTLRNSSRSMAPIKVPYRARCLEVADGSNPCQCQWFISPPSLVANKFACSKCGHGIHAHADYVSKIVHHCSPTHCVAYVQETPRTQACTCTAMLVHHRPMQNPYRLPEAPTLIAQLSNQDVSTGGVQLGSSELPAGDVAKPLPSISASTLAPAPAPAPVATVTDQLDTTQTKAGVELEKDAIFIQSQMGDSGVPSERSGQHPLVGTSSQHEESDVGCVRLLGRL